MNRIQFWILIAGSSLLVLFLLLQVVFTRSAQYQQARAVNAQQVVSEGRACDTRWRQIALRIYQVANQNQDQALKDLLVRQQISINPPPGASGAPSNSPAPAPR